MASQEQQLGRLKPSGPGPVGASVFFILLILFLLTSISGTLYVSARMRADAITQSIRFAQLSARSTESNISQSMLLLDTTLSSLVLRLRQNDAFKFSASRLSAYLSDTLYFTPQLKSLALLDKSGRILASSNIFELDVMLPVREFNDPTGSDLIHIGRPWAGADFASGRPVSIEHPLPEGAPFLVPVSRTIKDSSKEYILLASLDTNFFAAAETRNLNNTEAQLTLLRHDGLTLMTTDPAKTRIGQTVPPGRVRDAIESRTSAAFDMEHLLDGPVIIAVEPAKLFPLVVAISLDRSSVLAEPQRENQRFITLAASSILVISLLSIALYLREQRRLREVQRAENLERQRQKALLDSLPASLAMISPEGKISLPNALWQDFVDAYTTNIEGGVGMTYADLWRLTPGFGKVPPHIMQKVEDILKGKESSVDFELPFNHDNEHQRWFQVSVRPMAGAGLPGMVMMSYDITARKEAEAQSRLAKQVFDASAEGIVVTDEHCLIVSMNPAATRISGYTIEEARGQTPRLFSSHTHGPEHFQSMWESVLSKDVWQGEMVNRRKDGSLYAEWLTVSAIRDEQGKLINYAGIFTDISERKAVEEKIRYLSEHDALTSLPNRILFQDQLGMTIARAERNQQRFALFFIDLDRFKVINDTLGHVIGDQLLQAVAIRIRECLRSADTLCRQGGDEFLVLLDGVEQPEDAARVAGKLLEHVGKIFKIDKHELRITPSIGIALYPNDGEDPVTLIKSADMAMYHSKDRGRNTYHFHAPEMDARATDLLALERGLRYALERKELSLHYQPLVDIHTGRIMGAEALMRWNSDELGMVSPMRFIPVAESSGLIVAMGDWALREACQQSQRWREAGFSDFKIAVNVSAIQVQQNNFFGSIQQVLTDTGLPPHLLELEVTESLLVDFSQHGSTLFDLLREKHIGLSIDDFGTGYSSLAYLRRLPLDKLKIDKSFVDDITTDPEDASIIKAIIGMARSLNLQVLAEGVETQEQLAILREYGCNQIQGYLFSRPLPADAFTELLQRSPLG